MHSSTTFCWDKTIIRAFICCGFYVLRDLRAVKKSVRIYTKGEKENESL